MKTDGYQYGHFRGNDAGKRQREEKGPKRSKVLVSESVVLGTAVLGMVRLAG